MIENYTTLIEIRQYIDENVASGNREISYENLTKQIEGIEEIDRPQKLEALILLGYFLKKDAKKTFKYSGELRELRSAANNIDLFDEFMSRCENLIYPRSLTSHGYSRIIGTNNSALLTRGILAVVDEMDSIGYKIFINSGTLLGVIRNNTYIPHDNDVDFALLLHSSDPISAAHEWIDLKETMAKMGLLKNIGWMGGILKTKNIGPFSVDLFPAWVEGDSVFIYPHTFGDLKRDDVLPLQKSRDLRLPIPNCPEKMLAINYGPDWRTPDPLFRFPWGKARNKFTSFLEITEEMDPRNEIE